MEHQKAIKIIDSMAFVCEAIGKDPMRIMGEIALLNPDTKKVFNEALKKYKEFYNEMDVVERGEALGLKVEIV